MLTCCVSLLSLSRSRNNLIHPLSEVSELRDILSVSDEQCLGDVVGAHLVLLLECGALEPEAGEAPVEVQQGDHGHEGKPQGVVAEGSAARGLEFTEVEFAGQGGDTGRELVHSVRVHFY
jgi:hypothetical protein